MAFTDFPEQQEATQLLQRSLDRGRLGHAYLFCGANLDELEGMARTLAKTLNCASPPRRSAAGLPLDCCDHCRSCRHIDGGAHPDVQWVRPEAKSRQITIDQLVPRENGKHKPLTDFIYQKPTEAEYKFGIIVAADRLTVQAANAFLKTLEEPPGKSILILLSTEPGRMLETILSRCLRLNFAGESARLRDPALLEWLAHFTENASQPQGGLLNRYRLLAVLLKRLGEIKTRIEEVQTKRSPLEKYEDVEPDLRDRWEEELKAAVESEYRRERADLLAVLEWWLRDVWLETQQLGRELFSFPQLAGAAQAVARRLSPADAMENLGLLEQTQRLLTGNVQEALALEVGLLKLKL